MDKRTFVVGNKVVNSIPDLSYALKKMPPTGRIIRDDTLLFVVEVFVSFFSHSSDPLLTKHF